MARAECLIVVLDGSVALTPDDRLVLAETADKRRILVRNKGDLPTVWLPQDLETSAGEPLLTLSARHGKGLAELEATIVHLAVGQEALNRDEAVLTQARHRRCLDTVLKNVCAAADGLRQGVPLEFVAFDVTEAIQQVSEILGESCAGDVLDRIFSRFCIGK
jgi:tRNA modification GTPase